MIADETRLAEVLAEISDWPLAERRSYIDEIEKSFGVVAAQQIKTGLERIWKQKTAK